MKLITFLVTISYVLSPITLSAQDPTYGENKVLREGDYVSEEYLKTLRQNHSPWKAKDKSKTVSVSRSKNGNIRLDFWSGGRHDVVESIHLDNQGTVIANRGTSLSGFQILSSNSFVIRQDKELITYRRSESLDELINDITIAGTYQDGEGKRYTFTKQGKAIFPNRSFHYVVATDFVGSPYDKIFEVSENGEYLTNKSAWNVFWEMNGKELRFFKEASGVVGLPEPEPQPFLVLTRSR